MSVSKTIDAAKSAKVGVDETLCLTHRGLVLLLGPRFPKHALPLTSVGRETDWADVATRITAWAERYDIELDP